MLDEAARAEIEQAAGTAGLTDKPLGELTTLGCGGPAGLLIEANSSGALARIMAAAQHLHIPWFILGHGSNLLVADEGWPGLVIKLAGEFKECRIDGTRLRCGAGASLPRAAKLAARNGLAGLEALAHIPGTIGGALSMNAGAYGTSIGDLVESVEICLPGEVKMIAADELVFGYRSSGLPTGSIISGAVLTLMPFDPEAIAEAMLSLRRQREESQPIGAKTCGSVFKNPTDGKSAGQLLDQAGCKGLTAGGAVVSGQHANFIINQGDATAADVLELMNICRQRVKERFGVTLEPEVRLLGPIELEAV